MLQAKGKMLGKYPNHYSKKRKKNGHQEFL